MILPATLATVNALFTGRERAVAFAIWGSTFGVFGALGPLLGGLLTTDVSWRWAFLANLFIGAIVVAGILLVVPETSPRIRRIGLDLPGNLLAMLWFASVIFAPIESDTYGRWSAQSRFVLGGLAWPSKWPSPISFVCALGVASLTAFAFWERQRLRRGRPVLMDLSLFRVRSLSAGLGAILMVTLGEFGILFTLPFFFEGVLGYSALATGAIFLAIATGTLLAGGATPERAKSVGARGVARLGLALEVAGLAGPAASISPTVNVWLLVPWLLAYGAGLGMASALPGREAHAGSRAEPEMAPDAGSANQAGHGSKWLPDPVGAKRVVPVRTWAPPGSDHQVGRPPGWFGIGPPRASGLSPPTLCHSGWESSGSLHPHQVGALGALAQSAVRLLGSRGQS